MVKKVLIILLLCIFVLQGVSAATTEIQIKTPSFCEVHLTILDASTSAYSAIASYKNNSDFYGDVTFTHSSDDSVFDLMVVLKKADKRIYSEQFRNDYVAGQPIYLEIIPEGYELIETPNASENTTNSTEGLNETEDLNQTQDLNETLNETNITIEDTEPKNRSGILGFSIFNGGENGEEFSFPKFLYYIIGGILLLVIAFFVFKFLRTKKTHKIKITKLSDVKSSKTTEDKDTDSKEESAVNKIIKEAEEKIKQAQEELNGLKKEQRIKEIKETMLREQKELDGLSH